MKSVNIEGRLLIHYTYFIYRRIIIKSWRCQGTQGLRGFLAITEFRIVSLSISEKCVYSEFQLKNYITPNAIIPLWK